MTTTTPKARPFAIVTALAFTAGSLAILMGAALLTPTDWTAYHWLTILTVFGTIAAGHLSRDAAHARRWLSVAGFLVLFLSGTALVVANSVGRQAETTDAKALDADALNSAITAKSNALADARQRLIKAQDKVELYTNGGRDTDTGQKIKPGCARICEDWKQNRSDLVRVIGSLERDLKEMGPKKPPNAKAERFAELVALFGYDKAKAAAAFILSEPFIYTLFFEIGTIVSFGFAFPHVPVAPSDSRSGSRPEGAATPERLFEDVKAEALANPSERSALADIFTGPAIPNGSNVVDLFKPDGHPNGSGPKGGRRVRRTDRKTEVQADIVARRDRGERFDSQEDLRAVLSERFGPLSKSTLHDWLAELPDVPRRIEGRRKVVG